MHLRKAYSSNRIKSKCYGGCFLALTDKDVLFGKGMTAQSHIGNQRFRSRVKQHQREYDALKARQKTMFTTAIMKAFKSDGIRFMDKVDDANDVYEEVTDEQVICRKISHVFRSNRKTATKTTATTKSSKPLAVPSSTSSLVTDDSDDNGGDDNTGDKLDTNRKTKDFNKMTSRRSFQRGSTNRKKRCSRTKAASSSSIATTKTTNKLTLGVPIMTDLLADYDEDTKNKIQDLEKASQELKKVSKHLIKGKQNFLLDIQRNINSVILNPPDHYNKESNKMKVMVHQGVGVVEDGGIKGRAAMTKGQEGTTSVEPMSLEEPPLLSESSMVHMVSLFCSSESWSLSPTKKCKKMVSFFTPPSL